MASRTSCLTASAVCLALGFGAGWMLHRAPVRERSAAPSSSHRLRRLPAAEPTPSSSTVVSATVPEAAQPSIVTQRLATLAWLKTIGVPLQIAPTLFPSDRLNPIFVQAFELSPDEVTKLQASLAQARRQNSAMLAAAASGGVSADGTQLVVEVKPSPEAGGRIHDGLFASFEQVLGAERYQLFNQLSADAFERSFEGFGLNAVSYTMKLQPAAAYSGHNLYDIVSKSSQPDGSWISRTSRFDGADVQRMFPVLESFLPPGFGQPAAK